MSWNDLLQVGGGQVPLISPAVWGMWPQSTLFPTAKAWHLQVGSKGSTSWIQPAGYWLQTPGLENDPPISWASALSSQLLRLKYVRCHSSSPMFCFVFFFLGWLLKYFLLSACHTAQTPSINSCLLIHIIEAVKSQTMQKCQNATYTARKLLFSTKRVLQFQP